MKPKILLLDEPLSALDGVIKESIKMKIKQIAKELKRAVNLRSACQVANLGVSLILLGLIIPIWTRRSTKKKHAEAIRQAQSDISSNVNLDKDVSSSSSTTVTKTEVA